MLVFSKDRPATHREPSGAAPVPLDLSTGWTVTFVGAAEPSAMNQLVSWTRLPGRRFYSGQAAYERTFTVDGALLKSGRAFWLNFGEGSPVAIEERRSGSGMRAMLESPVREAAVVYVNGKPAGSVWRPPYEVDVSGLLQAGENRLRVVVANLAINQLAAQPLPDYRALIAKYGERFQEQDMKGLEPLPSGLLGPVRLLAR